MKARYLLDTDTSIFLRKRRPASVTDRFAALKPGEAVMSVINYGELQYGARKLAEPEKALRLLDELVGFVPAMALPACAALVYGTLRATLERRGEIIGANDLWIAAHALADDLILVSNNVREFSRVPGLRLENWVST